MNYPDTSKLKELALHLEVLAGYKTENGSDTRELIGQARNILEELYGRMLALPEDAELAAREPNDLEAIRRLCPAGPRALGQLEEARYRDKLEGALLARSAGCALGAPVENWTVKEMEDWAAYTGDPFPLVNYWKMTKSPGVVFYNEDRRAYTAGEMDGIPSDDDLGYTLLGLLIAEDYGVDFTTEDAGKGWLKYLPYACTAEEIALDNLRAGVPALEAAERGNPYLNWIGADIRCDGYAYIAAGHPQKAAEMAYRDAYLSHRRTGIYGSMFFAAAQAAAFCVDTAREALEIGLTEIPAECGLAADIRWALEVGNGIRDYRQAREAVDRRFPGMSTVHTNNNACLTVFGLLLGQGDVLKTLSETVAMGMDNDCTAATAGSIVGAIAGKDGVPPVLTRNFHNTLKSHLTGNPSFSISGLVDRFTVVSKSVWG